MSEKTKILIVEEETVIALDLRNTPQKLGYQVTSIVPSGKESIVMVEQDIPDVIIMDMSIVPSGKESIVMVEQDIPDVIIMDIKLVGELDGIEAAEQIRLNHLDISEAKRQQNEVNKLLNALEQTGVSVVVTDQLKQFRITFLTNIQPMVKKAVPV